MLMLPWIYGVLLSLGKSKDRPKVGRPDRTETVGPRKWTVPVSVQIRSGPLQAFGLGPKGEMIFNSNFCLLIFGPWFAEIPPALPLCLLPASLTASLDSRAHEQGQICVHLRVCSRRSKVQDLSGITPERMKGDIEFRHVNFPLFSFYLFFLSVFILFLSRYLFLLSKF